MCNILPHRYASGIQIFFLCGNYYNPKPPGGNLNFKAYFQGVPEGNQEAFQPSPPPRSPWVKQRKKAIREIDFFP